MPQNPQNHLREFEKRAKSEKPIPVLDVEQLLDDFRIDYNQFPRS